MADGTDASQTFLTDSDGGRDTTFVDASEVALAHVTETGVALYLKGSHQRIDLPCSREDARTTVHLLGDSTNAAQIDRDALALGGDPELVSRAAIVQASRKRDGGKPANVSIPETANEKLLEIYDGDRGHKIKAIKACRDSTGMSLKESKEHVETLVTRGEADFGPYADHIRLGAFDDYL